MDSISGQKLHKDNFFTLLVQYKVKNQPCQQGCAFPSGCRQDEKAGACANDRGVLKI
jgi:hypothetical protein